MVKSISVAWLSLALFVAGMTQVFAQLAPTGDHYAGRPTDTGYGGGFVSAAGGFAASIPFELPPSRGDLPIPLQITYGPRSVGAAGLGWDLAISYIKKDRTFAKRQAVPQTRSLTTMVDMTTMVPSPSLTSTGYALADTTGNQFLVYNPTGGAISVNLSKAGGIGLNATWLNTTTGLFSTTQALTGGSSSQAFVAPFDGATPAALLIVPNGVSEPPTDTGSCACNAGNTPNICSSNANPKQGNTITVTLVCGSKGFFIGFQGYPVGTPALINEVPTNGVDSGTFTMTAPNFVSDTPTQWNLNLLAASDGGLVGTSSSQMTMPANATHQFGPSLPASVAAAPFTPAHTITVCPSGCNFQHPQDAIDSAVANGWDNVLVKLYAGDYPFDTANGVGRAFRSNSLTVIDAPAHIWIKGVVGTSGTNGTVFPHFHGFDSAGTGSSIITTLGHVDVTIDNVEIGPYPTYVSNPSGFKNTYRNTFFHDTPGMRNSDSQHEDLYIYNSQFSHNGGGSICGHQIYNGNGDKHSELIMKNSILEQAVCGHDLKSRAASTTATCSKILMGQDAVFQGSELIDCSEGRTCNAFGNLLVEGPASPSWRNQNTVDLLRYGADGEFRDPAIPSAISLQNNVWINDAPQWIRMAALFSGNFTTTYPATGNKFTFYSLDTKLYGNNPFVTNIAGDFNTGGIGSAVIWADTRYVANLKDVITLGTIGVDNFIYNDRAAAGQPPMGTYPKGWQDPAFAGLQPAMCTEWIGNVKIPAN